MVDGVPGKGTIALIGSRWASLVSNSRNLIAARLKRCLIDAELELHIYPEGLVKLMSRCFTALQASDVQNQIEKLDFCLKFCLECL